MTAYLDSLATGTRVDLSLAKYHVVESGDPACVHAGFWVGEDGLARCGCGRTLRHLETVHMTGTKE